MDKNEYTKMRRKDRAITDDNILTEMLDKAAIVTMATCVDDQPFMHVTTFVYDQNSHAIYMHTAKQGMTRNNIEANPKVSFSVAEMGRLLPSKYAREMSVEYSSVIAFGKAEFMTDMDAAKYQMTRLVEKYFTHLKPEVDYRPITQKEIEEISVIKVSIESMSGKGKKESDDFDGAFEYKS